MKAVQNSAGIIDCTYVPGIGRMIVLLMELSQVLPLAKSQQLRTYVCTYKLHAYSIISYVHYVGIPEGKYICKYQRSKFQGQKFMVDKLTANSTKCPHIFEYTYVRTLNL